jgi:hypothetical protein
MNQTELLNNALRCLDQIAIDLFVSEGHEDQILTDIAAQVTEVRANLIRLRLFTALDDRMDEVRNRMPIEAKELPDIKPSGVEHIPKYKGIDVKCPKCGAKKGDPCIKMGKGRPNQDGTFTPAGEPMAGKNVHAERGTLARKRAIEKGRQS